MLHNSVFIGGKNFEWVVFIHGAGGSSTVWHKQIKVFSEHFNVVLLDLRGHGKSINLPVRNEYSFDFITEDVIQTINDLGIKKAHFAGVSLGTLIVKNIAILKPDMVQSITLTGAITNIAVLSKMMIWFGRTFISIIPYIYLYRMFAHVIMPRKNHKESRLYFIKEVQNISKQEFFRWFKLTSSLQSLINTINLQNYTIPTIYIMGDQDYLFLKPFLSEEYIKNNERLEIIANCGHVVNIEKSDEFNKLALKFMKSNS